MTIRVSWPDMYPDDSFSNGVNWSPWLADQTIADRSFEVLSGEVTLSEEETSGTNTIVRVSGGTPGLIQILCGITTNQNNHYSVVAEFVVLALPD